MIEFFIAALVVAIAPGPDNLFVLAQSATYGAKAGFSIIAGLCTGIFFQTCFLVAGVSALLAASPKAFFALQCLGAAYLLYLAYKSFTVRTGTISSDRMTVGETSTAGVAAAPDVDTTQDSAAAEISKCRLYARGIIMNMTNPKAVLFVLSFIPPAVNLDRKIHPALQTFILGGEFICATFIVFGSVALLAGAVKRFLLNSPKANRNLNWFSGVVFIFLAVALFVL
ncbi:MAG: LysE family translocator [Fibrobacter sp.]|nr:LysE family translocator [Fibrobacter sp.]